MILSVTGQSGDFPITWCGVTWVYSGATGAEENNGGQARVCPTNYVDTPQYNVAPYVLAANERWTHIGSGRGLKLCRRDLLNTGTLGTFSAYNVIVLFYTGQNFGWTNGVQTNNGGASFEVNNPASFDVLNLGTINNPIPTTNDYQILDVQFGSYTNGTVTYKWSKGNGW